MRVLHPPDHPRNKPRRGPQKFLRTVTKRIRTERAAGLASLRPEVQIQSVCHGAHRHDAQVHGPSRKRFQTLQNPPTTPRKT